jgi:hypothetical protein
MLRDSAQWDQTCSDELNIVSACENRKESAAGEKAKRISTSSQQGYGNQTA